MLFDPSTYRIVKKELNLFFTSPVAYLFLGCFVAITLFIFFWGEKFFARNIADVRPMFEWMPILLIFLSSALTMRMWSEERRTGTLEHLITLPISPWQFVIGKFLACMVLLGIALTLTLPLPISLSFMANFDWGPIASAYLATLLLGGAYLSIGLFVSSRSENQIVSLILTVIIASLFYLIGSKTLTGLVSNDSADLLRAIATGSRFESITRGVIDFRDLYYYGSIIIAFLTLNRFTLEKLRWASDGDTRHHDRWRAFTALVIVNALLANVWLSHIGALRSDVTEGKIYSISDATRNHLGQLQEPLLIRGYFSDKTHPLLAPLVPQVKDLLKEYEHESDGNILIEIIDPVKNPEAEEEAARKYGIQPQPFRVNDRHQSALVNSYFNILIHYGDEYKVLGFRDLIDVKASSESDIDVQLRNPEYDITNAIKQVLYAYQSAGNLFDNIKKNVTFTAYVSAENALPSSLQPFKKTLEKQLKDIESKANGQFKYSIIDPDEGTGAVAKDIAEQYGFRPMASSLFDTNTFYFYMVMQDDDIGVQIPIPDDLSEDGLQRGIDAALKRFASGFTKTIGLVTPPAPNHQMMQMGMPAPESFQMLQQVLNENMTAKIVDLKDGKVSDDIDLLMLLAPENLDEKSLFAVDQFLMKGGTVIASSSPYKVSSGGQNLSAMPLNSGLNDWLKHHGLTIDDSLVMDTQNAAFPVPMPRNLGGFTIQEIAMLDYPYFVDVREDGLNQDVAVTSGLPQLTVPWASPISVNDEKLKQHQVVKLIHSSENAWISKNTDITPQVKPDGSSGFNIMAPEGQQLLAVSLEGRFTSFFDGKESPLLKTETTASDANSDDATEEKEELISSVIAHSPESARLVLVSSNSFAADRILGTLGSANGTQYLEPVQMLVNAAEWSLEDSGLLSIRSRGHFNRTLPPLSTDDAKFWEYLNYGLAFLALMVVFGIRQWREVSAKSRYQQLLAGNAVAGGQSA